MKDVSSAGFQVSPADLMSNGVWEDYRPDPDRFAP